MQNIMKKLVGFLIVSSIWLLPLILPEIQAQQTATPPSTAASSPAITIEELKSRRMAIESMTDIDATVKTDSLKLYRPSDCVCRAGLQHQQKGQRTLRAHPDSPRAVENIAGRAEKAVHGA